MKSINQSRHIGLLQAELDFQIFQFEKTLATQAAKMFVEKKLFICRYQGYDELRGNVILKFDSAICQPPRKNENLQCFVSRFQDNNVRQWGGITYQDLRSECLSQFEAKTVFYNYENEHIIVGVSGIKETDVVKFEHNALVFLGPTDPPLKYLMNLVDFVSKTSPETNPYLNIVLENENWDPEPLVSNDPVFELQTALIENDTVIIQGPPGTGKTYLMAQICNALLKADFRILVTALTNRALIELAEKDHLKDALKDGKVFKTSLTADEQKNKKIKGLKPLKNLKEERPPMLLSSYYVMSQIATKAFEEEHFDYVIIEEASQAFLSTLAIARKLGKKCIVIGDICQLEPIIQKEYSLDDHNNFHFMVCGLKALSFYYKSSKNYILTDSYRLTPNSVCLTNTFYNEKLVSKSDAILPIPFPEGSYAGKILNSNGGSSINRITMDNGISPCTECFEIIEKLIKDLILINPKVEIAILAFNRETVRALQSRIFSEFSKVENLLIETVDRIQGMTVDYCFYIIPQESIPFSIQSNRFNVATSRARLCTLIISDSAIDAFTPHYPNVEEYINRIK